MNLAYRRSTMKHQNTQESRRDRLILIQQQIIECRAKGILTSNDEEMSLAAIGRTIDPPVSRVMVWKVASGQDTSRRVAEAINRELKKVYFMLN